MSMKVQEEWASERQSVVSTDSMLQQPHRRSSRFLESTPSGTQIYRDDSSVLELSSTTTTRVTRRNKRVTGPVSDANYDSSYAFASSPISVHSRRKGKQLYSLAQVTEDSDATLDGDLLSMDEQENLPLPASKAGSPWKTVKKMVQSLFPSDTSELEPDNLETVHENVIETVLVNFDDDDSNGIRSENEASETLSDEDFVEATSVDSPITGRILRFSGSFSRSRPVKIILLLLAIGVTSVMVVQQQSASILPIPGWELESMKQVPFDFGSAVFSAAKSVPASVSSWYDDVIVGSLGKIKSVLVAQNGSKSDNTNVEAKNFASFSEIADNLFTSISAFFRPKSRLNGGNPFSKDIFPEPGNQGTQSLIERVANLESTLIDIRTVFNDASLAFANLISNDESTESQIYDLRAAFMRSLGRVEVGLKETTVSIDEKMKQSLTSLTQSLELMRKQIDENTKLDTKRQSAFDSQILDLKRQIHIALSDFESLKERTSKFELSLEERVFQLIESRIPSLPLARKDRETGKIILDPEFLIHLKQVLTLQQAVSEPQIVEMINRNLSTLLKDVISREELKAVLDEVAAGSLSVQDLDSRLLQFATVASVSELEHAVRQIMESTPTVVDLSKKIEVLHVEFLRKSNELVSSHLNGGGDSNKVILTRQEVLQLMNEHISKAKEEMDFEIGVRLASVKDDGDKYDFESLKSVMDTLIQSALTKYMADGIGREDFALEAQGAYIVDKLTSNSFSLPSSALFGRFIGYRHKVGWGPFVAINEGVAPRKCWAMDGPTGQLAVHLAAPVVPTAFTIDHLPKELLLKDYADGLQSAPKDVELWAVLGDTESFHALNLDESSSRNIPKEANKNYSPAGILMAQERFDPMISSVQTFSVNPEAKKFIEKLGIMPTVVVLRVTSNWGNKD
ncbi:hypothetical protein HDU83_008812, partial [Entophlyctis luteolus]